MEVEAPVGADSSRAPGAPPANWSWRYWFYSDHRFVCCVLNTLITGLRKRFNGFAGCNPHSWVPTKDTHPLDFIDELNSTTVVYQGRLKARRCSLGPRLQKLHLAECNGSSCLQTSSIPRHLGGKAAFLLDPAPNVLAALSLTTDVPHVSSTCRVEINLTLDCLLVSHRTSWLPITASIHCWSACCPLWHRHHQGKFPGLGSPSQYLNCPPRVTITAISPVLPSGWVSFAVTCYWVHFLFAELQFPMNVPDPARWFIWLEKHASFLHTILKRAYRNCVVTWQSAWFHITTASQAGKDLTSLPCSYHSRTENCFWQSYLTVMLYLPVVL